MGGLQRRGMMKVLPVAALVTIGPGAWRYRLARGGCIAAFMRSSVGATCAGAGTLALVAVVIGMAIARPTAMAAARLSQGLATAADDAERARLQEQLRALQHRNGVVSRVVAVM